MKRFKILILCLFFLFMLDYFLTYYGIRIGAITEMNPLWAAILGLPFNLGIAVRILYFVVIIYIPIDWITKKPTMCRPIFIKAFYSIAFAANICILGVHIYWITAYYYYFML